PNVRVGVKPTAFLRFDFSPLPSVTGADVQKATLTIFVNHVASAGSFDVNLATSAWDEGSITANTAPSLTATAVPSVPVALSDTNTFLTIDITAQVIGGGTPTVNPPNNAVSYMGPFEMGNSNVEGTVSMAFPVSGTISQLQVFVQGSPGPGKSWTLTLRVAGTNSSVTCTITGAATRCSDLVNTAAIP